MRACVYIICHDTKTRYKTLCFISSLCIMTSQWFHIMSLFTLYDTVLPCIVCPVFSQGAGFIFVHVLITSWSKDASKLGRSLQADLRSISSDSKEQETEVPSDNSPSNIHRWFSRLWSSIKFGNLPYNLLPEGIGSGICIASSWVTKVTITSM